MPSPREKHKAKLQAIFIFPMMVIAGFCTVINTVWTHRLGGVQPVWNRHGKVWDLHDSWLVWKQVLYGNSHQEIWREPSSFSNGWQRRPHLLHLTSEQIITEPDWPCATVVAGVWGSAFSILFNRVLGVKDTVGGSTMEEELGTIVLVIKIVIWF